MEIHDVKNALYNNVINPGRVAYSNVKKSIQAEVITPIMNHPVGAALTRTATAINTGNRYIEKFNGTPLGYFLVVNLVKLLKHVFNKGMQFYRGRKTETERKTNKRSQVSVEGKEIDDHEGNEINSGGAGNEASDQESFEQLLEKLDFDEKVLAGLVKEQELQPGKTVALHKTNGSGVMVDIQSSFLGRTKTTLHFYNKLDILAEGGSGKVFTLNSVVLDSKNRAITTSSQNLILKKAKGDVMEKNPEEMTEEVEKLKILESKYVQKVPHAVMTANGKITGYLTHKYDGDGNAFVSKILQDTTKGTLEIGQLKLNVIDRLSRGVLHIWKKGYMHKDHKLANTLYDNAGIVIADVGGDQKFADLVGAAREFVHCRNLDIEHGKATNVSQETKQDIKNGMQQAWEKVLGARTQSLTNPLDFNSLGDKLRPKTANGLPAKIDDLDDFMQTVTPELAELQNKMIVYSHGLLALSVIGGTKASDLHLKWPDLFVSPENKAEGGSLGYVKMKEGANQAAFADALRKELPLLTDKQVEIIWNSLSNDYKQRSSLEEFTEAFKQNRKAQLSSLHTKVVE